MSQPGLTFQPQDDDSCSVTSSYPFLIYGLHSTLFCHYVPVILFFGRCSFNFCIPRLKAERWLENYTVLTICFLRFLEDLTICAMNPQAVSSQLTLFCELKTLPTWCFSPRSSLKQLIMYFPELHKEPQLQHELAELRQPLPLLLHLYVTTVLTRGKRCVCNLIALCQDKMIITISRQ